jgi:hypothetical protein
VVGEDGEDPAVVMSGVDGAISTFVYIPKVGN